MADKDSTAQGAAGKDAVNETKSGDACRKEQKDDVRIEGEEILSLLEEVRQIDKPSALRKLNISSETYDRLVKSLAKDGWIRVIDGELDTEYFIEQAKDFKERARQLEEQQEKENIPAAPKKRASANPLSRITGRFLKSARSLRDSLTCMFGSSTTFLADLILLAAFIESVYLIKIFLQNPNQHIMNFVAFAVISSSAFLLYNNTRLDLKTRLIVKKVKGVSATVRSSWKLMALLALILLLVYSIGVAVFHSEHRVTSILLCTLVLNSIIQLYHPLKPYYRIPFSHIGMLMAVYSLLLLLGTTSISEILSGEQERLMDAFAGFALLAFVYLNRNFFGVSKAHFRRLIYRGNLQ